MSVLIKHMAMPKGCIYANDKDQTEYCPLLNHDDVPFCQYIETEPEIAIGIDERPVYCPLFDVSESCQDTVSRAAAVDALDEIESEIANGYGYQYPKWRKYFCELPSAQPEQRYTEEELRVFAHGISLSLLSKRSAQHWRYDKDTATEIEFLERLYDKVSADMKGRQG